MTVVKVTMSTSTNEQNEQPVFIQPEFIENLLDKLANATDEQKQKIEQILSTVNVNNRNNDKTSKFGEKIIKKENVKKTKYVKFLESESVNGIVSNSEFISSTEWKILFKPNITSDIGIYKWTNIITNKNYIGQSVNLQYRFLKYRYFNKSYSSVNRLLTNAFIKYGLINFTFTIIKYCTLEELDLYEIKYIKEFFSLVPGGYNLETGGNNNKILSQETKQKIRESNLGKTLTVEHKVNISNGSKAREENYIHNLKGTGRLISYNEKRNSYRTNYNGNNYEKHINSKRNKYEACADVLTHRILIEVMDELNINYFRKNRSKYN